MVALSTSDAKEEMLPTLQAVNLSVVPYVHIHIIVKHILNFENISLQMAGSYVTLW